MSIISWVLGTITVAVWGGGVVWTFKTLIHRTRHEQHNLAMEETILFSWSEKRLVEIMAKYPRSATPAFVYARQAQSRKDWDEALRRYQATIQRNRKDPRGWAGAVSVLRTLKRLDEAEALARKANRVCPKRAEVQQELAWNAMARADWKEAELRWRLHREYNPKDKLAWHQGQIALRKLGRDEEADALLADQKGRFRERFAKEAVNG